MDPIITAETLALLRKCLTSGDDLQKTITTSSGFSAYDLQAPAKNVYPVVTPLRNKIPRVPGRGGVATNWRVVSSILGSGYDAMPWIPEGQRSGRMSYSAAPKAANYVTLGEEDGVTFEAQNSGRNFEDVRAGCAMRLLQKLMLKEERAILGGNASVSLGTPATPTLSASGSSGTLPGAPTTYSVICVALTMEGMWNSSLAGGVATTKTITGADGGTYTLKGGSSQKSAAATQAVTLGHTLFMSVTPIAGAVGYAWYVGAGGAEKLEAITTINSHAISAPLAGTGQAVSAITADNSHNSGLAFDGLFSSAVTDGGYIKTMATGTAGTGTPLTASGRGSVSEIDVMLQAMWDSFQLSPTVLYVSSQELKNISNKVLSSGSSPLLTYQQTPGSTGFDITAGGVISAYFNPFTADGGTKIPLKLHPNVPAGTIVGYCENLPLWYQNNNVENVAEIHTRADYNAIDWNPITRRNDMGVYAEEVLAVYAPFATGIVTNIANG